MLKTSALRWGVVLCLKFDFQVSRQSTCCQPRFSRVLPLVHLLCVPFTLQRDLNMPHPPLTCNTLITTQEVPSLGQQGCRSHPKVQLLLSVKVALKRSVMWGFGKHGWLDIVWVKYCEGYQCTLLFPPYIYAKVTCSGTTELICTFPSCTCFFKSGWRIREVYKPPLCCYFTCIPFKAQDK